MESNNTIEANDYKVYELYAKEIELDYTLEIANVKIKKQGIKEIKTSFRNTADKFILVINRNLSNHTSDFIKIFNNIVLLIALYGGLVFLFSGDKIVNYVFLSSGLCVFDILLIITVFITYLYLLSLEVRLWLLILMNILLVIIFPLLLVTVNGYKTVNSFHLFALLMIFTSAVQSVIKHKDETSIQELREQFTNPFVISLLIVLFVTSFTLPHLKQESIENTFTFLWALYLLISFLCLFIVLIKITNSNSNRANTIISIVIYIVAYIVLAVILAFKPDIIFPIFGWIKPEASDQTFCIPLQSLGIVYGILLTVLIYMLVKTARINGSL